MDAQLKAQLKQVLAWKPSTASVNDYGEVQVGSTATALCRLESRTRSVEREFGSWQVTRSPLVILDCNVATPTFEALYWIPGTSAATAALGKHPKFIEVCIDENGHVDHWELEF